MSELKADKTFVFGEECEAYKKSEADKVIAGLKKSRMAWIHRFGVAEEGERHQKYKRCLRNAEGCLNKVWYYTEVHDCSASNRMWKWRQRWLELAEKFKEAK